MKHFWFILGCAPLLWSSVAQSVDAKVEGKTYTITEPIPDQLNFAPGGEFTSAFGTGTWNESGGTFISLWIARRESTPIEYFYVGLQIGRTIRGIGIIYGESLEGIIIPLVNFQGTEIE